MIKLGVFYCLEDGFKNDIESFKSFFSSKCEISKYLNHLPHLSLYVFNINSNNLSDVIFEFNKMQKSLNQFSSKTVKWKVFENDILTKLNTLCLEIELSNELKFLQMKVVGSLSKFHVKNYSEYEGELKLSNERHGYPFVGDHWIPHITIGSMDIKSENLLELSEKLFAFPQKISINNICLFKIKGDHHELIKKIDFERRS